MDIYKVNKSTSMYVFLLNLFHVLYMLEIFSHLKKFHGCFSTCIKTSQFVIN